MKQRGVVADMLDWSRQRECCTELNSDLAREDNFKAYLGRTDSRGKRWITKHQEQPARVVISDLCIAAEGFPDLDFLQHDDNGV
jgi:hypothetical protein